MRFILFLLVCFLCNVGFTQGGWDIGYIRIDSLKIQHIGMTVKPDFKSSIQGVEESKLTHIRHFVVPEDTAKVVLNKVPLTVVERRNIHVDWGFFKEQYLEIIGFIEGSQRIYNCMLIAFDQNEVILKAEVESTDDSGNFIELIGEFEFPIRLNDLNGMMIKI